MKITTRDDKVIEGEVSKISDDRLWVGKADAYWREGQVVEFSEIRSIEIEQESLGKTLLLISAVVIGVVLIVSAVQDGAESVLGGSN